MKRKIYTQKHFNWTNWTPAKITKIGESIIKNRKESIEKIKAVPKEERTFENTILPHDTTSQFAGSLFGYLDILMNASSSKPVRDTCRKVEVQTNQKLIELSFDRDLYKSLKEYKPKNLDPDQLKLTKDIIRDFEDLGFGLPQKKQNELLKIRQKIQEKATKHSENINEHRDFILVTLKDLDGFPDHYVDSLEIDKKTKKYKVSLDYPDYFPFMKYCKNETLRKRLQLKAAKAPGKANLKLLSELIELRKEAAKILGYKSHAHFKLKDRMAKKPEAVYDLIDKVEKKLSKEAKKELQELKDVKKRESKNTFGMHDLGYYGNILKKERYQYDDQTLNEYFELSHVMKEMLGLFSHLFNVKFTKENLKLWHKDVEIYSIKTTSGALRGYVAFDLFPRPGKFSHAAAFSVDPGYIDGSTYNTPFTTMLCNFAKPTKNKPALLPFSDVSTLFHEFGHLLHNTLTDARYQIQSGYNTSWDFVEVPSQLFEEWLLHDAYLKKVGKHYKTGKPIPPKIRKQMIAADKHLISYGYIRQLTLMLLDIELYSKNTKQDPKALFSKIQKKYTGLQHPEGSNFPASFGHIASGYDAGYYSYMWSLIYAKDIFSEFEKKGLFNKKLGKKLLNEILEKGSSRPEMESLKLFLGRNPSTQAFLKSLKK